MSENTSGADEVVVGAEVVAADEAQVDKLKSISDSNSSSQVVADKKALVIEIVVADEAAVEAE